MSYRAYTYLTDLILVLQNLDMYFRSYTCLTERILILRILYWYYKTYTCFTDTGVPVGTTELILIRISRRSYRVSSSDTRVPVGTTEITQIQEYP